MKPDTLLQTFLSAPSPSPARKATLGIIGFAASGSAGFDPACPFARIEAPVLAGDKYEIWSSSRAVSYGTHSQFLTAGDGSLTFGVMVIEDAEGEVLAARVREAYADLFAFAEGRHLLRVWNYLPRINHDSIGANQTKLERYRHFNQGRHQAFEEYYAGKLPPAASCLGIQGRALVIYFLLGNEPGIPIENPRQIAAYHYPPLYGPRSPNFSRALLAKIDGRQVLFISGTASIVGHESLYPNDVNLQTRETFANIEALLTQGEKHGFNAAPDVTKLKVYIRNSQDLPTVRALVEERFPAAEIVYLHADICREELLVEIEALIA